MAVDATCKSDNKGCWTDHGKSRHAHGQTFQFKKPNSKTQGKKGFFLKSKSEFGWALRSFCVQWFTANTGNSLPAPRPLEIPLRFPKESHCLADVPCTRHCQHIRG